MMKMLSTNYKKHMVTATTKQYHRNDVRHTIKTLDLIRHLGVGYDSCNPKRKLG